MKTPTRFILTLAGSALVVAGLPMSAAQADDVNLTPTRSTTGTPAFDAGAAPFSVAVLPDGSRVLVGSTPDVGNKVASFLPNPGSSSQFLLEGSILGNDHGFGSAVGLSFDSAKRVWLADATGHDGFPVIRSYAAGFHPGIADLPPRLTVGGSEYSPLQSSSDVVTTRSGEIVVSDNLQSKVLIFPANSGGDIRPVRYIETGIGTPYGIALDSADQIYVANNSDDSITVYPANATSTTGPSRTIKGSNTQLSGPRKIAVDTSGSIYVTNGNSDSVVVFAAGATGNATPIKRIVGAGTELNSPAGIALDAARRLYVVNSINSGAGKVLVQFPTVVPFKVPTAVRSVRVSGLLKSSSRTISWTAPASNGGTPVTKYLVVVKKGSTTLVKKTVTGRSYKVLRSKLKNGANTVYIYSYNRVGRGPVVKKNFGVKK